MQVYDFPGLDHSTCSRPECKKNAYRVGLCKRHYLGDQRLAGVIGEKQFVYAIQAENGAVRIGFSTNPHARCKFMQTDCPLKLTLIGTMLGSPKIEAMIHGALRADRIRGEWFDGNSKAVKKIVRMFDGLDYDLLNEMMGIALIE